MTTAEARMPSSYRTDGSGTTFNFVATCPRSAGIANQVGENVSVKWPTGIGGKGNEGVAAYVKQIKGGVGYVELSYALQKQDVPCGDRTRPASGAAGRRASRPQPPVPTGPAPRTS